MDDDDWDLQAVVRGRRLTNQTASVAAETRDPFSSFPSSHPKAEETPDGDKSCLDWCFPGLHTAQTAVPELEELCRPFFLEAQHQLLPSAHRSNPPSSYHPAAGDPEPPHRPSSQISRSKRRKNQQKRVVCHVPADGVSSDMWAWRKYGQKPIKGSPYPRGYYKCSSSKGCPARKQVERSHTDPAELLITYTAEHNHPIPAHRNSLAGISRHKFTSSATASTSDNWMPPENPSSSPPSSSTAAGMSPNTPLTTSMEDELLRRRRRTRKGGVEEDEEEDEEGMLLVEDMEVLGEDDLLFVGAEQGDGSISAAASATVTAFASDFFDDDAGLDEHFFPSSWVTNNSSSNNNAAAAAGGG